MILKTFPIHFPNVCLCKSIKFPFVSFNKKYIIHIRRWIQSPVIRTPIHPSYPAAFAVIERIRERQHRTVHRELRRKQRQEISIFFLNFTHRMHLISQSSKSDLCFVEIPFAAFFTCCGLACTSRVSIIVKGKRI